MVERGGSAAPGGELLFGDEELAAMNAVLLGGAERRRPLSVVDERAEVTPVEVPGSPTRPTLRQRAFNPLDVLVDAAFARDAGDASWHQRDDDGIEPAAPRAPPPGFPLPPPSVPRPAAATAPATPARSTRPLPAIDPSALSLPPAEEAARPTAPAASPPRVTAPQFPVATDDASLRTSPSPPPPPPPSSSGAADPARPRTTAPSLPVAVPSPPAPVDPARLKTVPSMPSVIPSSPSPSTPSPSSVASSVPPALVNAVLAATAPASPAPPAAPVSASPSPAVSVPAAAPSSLPPVPPPAAAVSPPPAPTTPAVAGDARLKTTPSLSVATPQPAVAADGRPKTTPSMAVASPAVPSPAAAAPATPAAPPTSDARARPAVPSPPTPLPRSPAAVTNGTPATPPRAPLAASMEDAVFSSSPPPGPETLRDAAPEPPSFRVVVAPVTPRLDAIPVAMPAAASPAPARHQHDAEEIEAAEIEEVSEEPPAAVAGVRVAPPVPPRRSAPPAHAEPGAEPEARGRPRRRRRAKPWFEEVFDESWLATLPAVEPAQTEREAGFLADALNLQPGASVLDVGCGVGSHAVALAVRGHEVTGLDLSLPLIIRAADGARQAGVNVNFVHGDMREMTFDAQFDAAYCYFTTFGYFDDDTNRAVAALVNKALKPGGRFLIDVVNRDFLLTEVPARLWWQADGCMVLEELDFNYFTSRLQNRRSIVFEDARQLEFDVSVRAYSLHEIGKLLHAAGFRVTEVSGSAHTRGRFFGGESRQILIVAEKK